MTATAGVSPATEALMARLRGIGAGRIVEVGCGATPVLAGPAAEGVDVALVGVDLDVVALRQAHAVASPVRRAVFVCGDGRALPLADESADAVLLRGILHHSGIDRRLLGECRRVLRTGGRLLVQDGGPLRPEEFAAMNTEITTAGLAGEPHPGVATGELVAELSGLGFSVRGVTWSGMWTFASPPFTSREWAVPAFLLEACR